MFFGDHTMILLPNFECELTYFYNNEFFTETITLENFIKKNNKGLVLYFYPKDNTAGCTVQAVDFSNDFSKFEQLGYTVVGISRDSIKSHQNFIKKHTLTIPLISDKDEKLCQYFDVIKEKTLYGKKVLGVVRSTFVFNKKGELLHELRSVKSKEHSEKLYQLLTNNDNTIKF